MPDSPWLPQSPALNRAEAHPRVGRDPPVRVHHFPRSQAATPFSVDTTAVLSILLSRRQRAQPVRVPREQSRARKLRRQGRRQRLLEGLRPGAVTERLGPLREGQLLILRDLRVDRASSRPRPRVLGRRRPIRLRRSPSDATGAISVAALAAAVEETAVDARAAASAAPLPTAPPRLLFRPPCPATSSASLLWWGSRSTAHLRRLRALGPIRSPAAHTTCALRRYRAAVGQVRGVSVGAAAEPSYARIRGCGADVLARNSSCQDGLFRYADFRFRLGKGGF
eukprot:scaffold731_cov261-Pinguiococcus_pyrenoidosus.AAC.35